jgi:hypothetical protein
MRLNSRKNSNSKKLSFFVNRAESMFINNMAEENMSLLESSKRSPSNRYITEINRLESKMTTSKLFMNMVIHDLRNPAEAIKEGLNQAKAMMKREQQNILKDTHAVLLKNIINKEMRISRIS